MILAKLKKFFTRSLLALIIFAIILSTFFTGALFTSPQKASAGYSPNGLCSDAGFTNVNALTAQGIQILLSAKGSFLRSFSENGRSAAQIIYDAARANGINPIAILATLQKETGIVYGAYAGSPNQWRLDRAMGYACFPGVSGDNNGNGCRDSDEGFTNQVNNGTWQLRYNYDVWAINGSDWNVGRTMVIDGTNVTFGSRCTSALYRYTPHLGGNYNFNYYFNIWGGEGLFEGRIVAQGPRSGPGSYGSEILPNQTFTLWVSYLNTGNTTWSRNWTNATPNPVHLGMSSPNDRGSAFTGGANVRAYLARDVLPGQIGTFYLRMTAPSQPGFYVEKFRPVAEYIKWFGDEGIWYLNVSTESVARGYKADYIGIQGPRTGPGAYGVPMSPGQSATLWVNLRNSGTNTWYNYGNYPTDLGTADPRDRGSAFLGGQNRRGRLIQSSVAPGNIGTFAITITAPSARGTYVEKFQPVTESITWMEPSIVWYLIVQ
ncbi:hypothetical protein A2V71_03955 [Candidatus Berkelbacteria bacterium RBG_13_40_8]|uniref:Nbr1 FW domain-containing protein n=1 Tax=Candidatus Berkelbacteria bacterium RBG_13_40_8 TaxID=1797467 RepID=A0A1F5DLQ5_9BACT|nr:MAG: hypothetical protein A2V71_03955 [Candidatus Berkelbacteria bacterium RBG_13_40_8]